ncbi:hypothetical protein K437DRAFT_275581 [Tilletiaria anomala UBC 951]|uniref:HIT domain-containing protein n=1 Tax=Tilletiaria anomala (strain ATCC 24038 / CBS 436.72 / UBC 951) TaxID=1037660 RepID=A0A066VGV5_TILAU|nr:uncharacterized protein K437DRAFT_275581 [Tilletiaria anomala UBC 951]KDN40957.1 hypothetical protein K437DRAFT_275581 [Tilletiaria anomala UBC 951]
MVSPPDLLLSCLGLSPEHSRSRPHGLYSPLAKVADPPIPLPASANCIFCNPTRAGGFRIVHEDNSFIAFYDRSPAARVHLLVVPRVHIANVKTLRSRRQGEGKGDGNDDDAKLIKQMHAFGQLAIDIAARELQHDTDKGAGCASIETRAKMRPGQERYADEVGIPGARRFGFHIPPFRSVDHLHLHCLLLPFVSPLKALKYHVTLPSHELGIQHYKGYSWFVQWRQCVDILVHGGKVGVRPC